MSEGCKKTEKRIDRLIRSFRIFSLSHETWQLMVIGDGPDKIFAQELVEQLGLGEKVTIAEWQHLPWEYISNTGG